MSNYYTNSVVTSNGTYNVGMTKADAERNNSYKCFCGIDFKDLDKDQNNVLSLQEILEGQVKATKRDLFRKGAFGGAIAVGGVALAATGIGSIALGSFGFAAEGAIAEAAAFGAVGASASGLGGVIAYIDCKPVYAKYKKAVEELEQYKNDKEAQKTDAKYKKLL